jgi:hypothetical protein
MRTGKTTLCEEKPVKNATTVGVLGSLVINLMLGLAVAAVFSVTPAAQARDARCAAEQAVQPTLNPTLLPEQGDYVVATRMGWAAG